ncbi:MAG: hypothetical protein AAF404_00270 [Pseudomonadota bacterium]
MKNTTLVSVTIAATAVISACNPAGDPVVDMCQKITQNLVGTIETWEEPKKSEGRRFATVEVAYLAASGERGVGVCKHPKENETYRTSPTDMTLNGVEVAQKDLMSAAFGATKTIAKDTAEHTKEKSIELAQEASEKAKTLAADAQVLAEEARVKAEELSAKAKTMAGEAKETASKLAVEARAKATEMAAKASELSEVAAEKARAAALEATKTVQDKLEN